LKKSLAHRLFHLLCMRSCEGKIIITSRMDGSKLMVPLQLPHHQHPLPWMSSDKFSLLEFPQILEIFLACLPNLLAQSCRFSITNPSLCMVGQGLGMSDLPCFLPCPLMACISGSCHILLHVLSCEPAPFTPTPTLRTQSGQVPGIPSYLGEEDKYRWGNAAREEAECTVHLCSARPDSQSLKFREVT
jgi:hypothetical protein